jgi:Tfp pilus assembly protein PilF
LALGAALAAVLGACGGSGQQQTSDPVASTPTVATPTPAPTQTPTAPAPTGPVSGDPDGDLDDAAADIVDGNYDSARRTLQGLLGLPDYAARGHYNLGVIAQSEGDGAGATRAYEDALRADPTFGPALTALIRMELSEGDMDGAQLVYQRALAQSQNAPGIRAAGLLIQLQVGNHEGVVREARAILIQEESNIDAHYALAMAYFRLGQAELAKLVLDEAVARAPARADLWLLRSNIQISQDAEVGAIQSLRRALDADPNFVEAHNNLGVLLHRARNEVEAIRHLRRAVELRPDFAEAYLNLSNALKADGQLEEAERVARRALAADRDLAQAYLTLGLLYLDTDFPGKTRLERLQAAVDHLNRYRDQMRASLPRGDQSEAYLNEALAALEAERALGERGGDPFGDSSGGGSEGETFEEETFEEETFEEETFEDEEWGEEEWEDE